MIFEIKICTGHCAIPCFPLRIFSTENSFKTLNKWAHYVFYDMLSSCQEQCQSQQFLSYFCIAAMDLFRVYCWPAGNCLQLKQSKHVNQLQQNIKNVEQSSHINQLNLMCTNTGDTQVSYSIPAYILLHMQRSIIWTTKGFLDHPMQRTCHYHGSLRC